MKKILWIILLFLCACTPQKYLVKTDTCYVKDVTKDSIYVHDSIFIKSSGDTVFVNKWHTKEREKIMHDTIYLAKTQEKVVEVEKTPKWVRYLLYITSGISVISIFVVLLKIFIKIYRRFHPI